MKKFLSLILLFVAIGLHAQIAIKGTVTSGDDGSALPGVSVVIKGTPTGVSTDLNGSYSINIPNKDAVLVFSFIGFSTQEILVENRQVIDVVMSVDQNVLDDVVVVGYSTKSRNEITKIGRAHV